MSFGFAAIGKRDDVVKQLRHVQVGAQNDNKVGCEVALLLARHIAEDAPLNCLVGDGYEQVYVVDASGHSGGGSALSLNVTVKSHYIVVPPDEADADSGETGA